MLKAYSVAFLSSHLETAFLVFNAGDILTCLFLLIFLCQVVGTADFIIAHLLLLLLEPSPHQNDHRRESTFTPGKAVLRTKEGC